MALGRPISLTNNVASKIIRVLATNNQTVFTVVGGYRINQIGIFRNGVRLSNNSDFTAQDGSTVTLANAAQTNDEVLFEIQDDFKVADAIVSAASTQTISGDLTVTGNISANIDGNASGLTGTPDIVVRNITGVAATFTGVLTYEDVTNIDSVGIITARSGIRVNAGGLVVAGISTLVTTTAADSSNAYNLVVRGNDSGTDDESAQIFLGAINSTTRGTAIAAQRKSSSNNHDLIFKTSAGGAVPTERLRITSDGKIGIGENSPDGLLVIKGDSNGTTNPSIRLKDGSDTREAWITNWSGDLLLANGGNDNVPHCVLKMFDGNIMTFSTANTERLRITSDGRLLINTTTADTGQLTVASTLHTSITIRSGNTTTNSNILFADATSGNGASAGIIQYKHSDDSLRISVNNGEHMRILSDGTISTGGISATPGTVAAGSIINDNANAGFFTNGYDGKFGTSSNNPVYIQVNGSSKLTIATDGTVSDSTGPLRRLGYRSKSVGFTLADTDAGKLIRMTGSGQTITVPNGAFAAGDMVSFFNVGTGTLTIAASGTTIYNTADAATGNRTIAAKGMATIVCTASNEFAINGSQLT